ncbi:protein RoBo-1-like [Hypomesus transpacificus]|uniref:protein RoBo-1-like n=1 Tax=Hypomesus transpacificus TaxID=137520 RepID=UPI001F087DEA|nr:protein RoBo-1-like [Hypomesus transpacificus]
MKLILTLCITWALLLTGESLQCVTCTDATCTNPPVKNCSSNDVCHFTTQFTTQSSSMKDPSVNKSCIAASNCMTPLNVTTTQLSVNLGFANFRQTQLCCDQDSCNNLTSPVFSPNGRNCSSCSSESDTVCNTTVNCVEAEDTCISIKVTGSFNGVLMGCASSNLCNAPVITSILPSVLPSKPSKVNVKEVSCNSAPSTGPVSVALMAMWLPIMVKLNF